MPDEILELGGSLIQHGTFSDRIYALRLAPPDMPGVLEDLEEMAIQQGYGKIVAKARGSDFGDFTARDYRAEALVPRFFAPGEAGVFMGKFLDPQRADPPDPERLKRVLQAAMDVGGVSEEEAKGGDPDGVLLREAAPQDTQAIAACYGNVFESYPFPIQEAAHLREAMDGGTRFFTAWAGDRLVAASSMEPGGADGTVEMTDFATLREYRGRGLATRLLTIMDRLGRASGKRIAYTIARARSYGMNITFARRGYRYAGRLINNTQISGAIESMNVWYKHLLA